MHWADLSDPSDRILGRILRRQAEKIPDAPLLLAGDARVSYGRANELANTYAAGLRGLGVERNDTVAVFSPGPSSSRRRG